MISDERVEEMLLNTIVGRMGPGHDHIVISDLAILHLPETRWKEMEFVADVRAYLDVAAKVSTTTASWAISGSNCTCDSLTAIYRES